MAAPAAAALLTGLSPAQREAVVHEGSALLVVSTAGSGKTRVLTHRACHLVQQGLQPERVLVATFTNRAAGEFRQRLDGLLGRKAQRLNMGTLHSTGARILRMFGGLAGFERGFEIYPGRDAYRLLIGAMEQLKVSTTAVAPSEVARRISGFKDNLIAIPAALEQAERGGSPFDRQIARLYERYQSLLHEENAMDLDDLIGNTVVLLERHPEVRQRIGYQHLLIDEFQDINLAQLRMIQCLLPSHLPITGVGDIDQAIFGFRHADHRIMLRFAEHFPGAATITLGQNYRSTQTIVNAAARVIQENTERINHAIWSSNAVGDPLLIGARENEEDEAEQIAGEVMRLYEEHAHDYGEFAVLSRNNRPLTLIEKSLIDHQIPYYWQKHGESFFDRREVKDVIGYLRILHRADDPAAVAAVINQPRRVLCKGSWNAALAEWPGTPLLEYLFQMEPLPLKPTEKKALARWLLKYQAMHAAVRTSSMEQLAEYVIQTMGLREYYGKQDEKKNREKGKRATDNLDRLLEIVSQQFSGPALEVLPEFLDYTALLADEGVDGTVNGVALSTIHSAKGGEYPIVFMIGVEQCTLPSYHALQDYERPREALEEERRLFYVGMTRAKERLYLSHAARRQAKSGRLYPCAPSMFIDEIPGSLKREREE